MLDEVLDISSHPTPFTVIKYSDNEPMTDDSLVVSEIKGKEAIMESIRDFLGKGK